MASIKYSDVFSRFYLRVQAYNLLSLTDEQVGAMQITWLHMAASQPYVRRQFTSWSMDDESEMAMFEMAYPIDDESDQEFVLEILSIGVALQWLEPQVLNVATLAQAFAGSSEKFYSQSAHLSELRALKASLQQEQRRIIADRGYAYNTYLDGGE